MVESLDDLDNGIRNNKCGPRCSEIGTSGESMQEWVFPPGEKEGQVKMNGGRMSTEKRRRQGDKKGQLSASRLLVSPACCHHGLPSL